MGVGVYLIMVVGCLFFRALWGSIFNVYVFCFPVLLKLIYSTGFILYTFSILEYIPMPCSLIYYLIMRLLAKMYVVRVYFVC